MLCAAAATGGLLVVMGVGVFRLGEKQRNSSVAATPYDANRPTPFRVFQFTILGD
jgi:hypothetical protein